MHLFVVLGIGLFERLIWIPSYIFFLYGPFDRGPKNPMQSLNNSTHNEMYTFSVHIQRQQQLKMGIEHVKLFNMINSWIIYLRLSSCHYVNKMIIGSSYGMVGCVWFVYSDRLLFLIQLILFAFDECMLLNCMLLSSPFTVQTKRLVKTMHRVSGSVSSICNFVSVFIFFKLHPFVPWCWKTNGKTKILFFFFCIPRSIKERKGFIAILDYLRRLRFDAMRWNVLEKPTFNCPVRFEQRLTGQFV